jgi:hypothetical protein
MDKDEALKLALEALKRMKGYGNTFGYRSWEQNPYEQVCEAITAIKQARSAPVQEPIGYLFQHEETGLTTVVDVQQVEWGFEKNNPRHQKIGPVYTTPPAAQRQWVDMPELELLGAYEEEQQGRFGDHVRGLLNVQAKLKEKNT